MTNIMKMIVGTAALFSALCAQAEIITPDSAIASSKLANNSAYGPANAVNLREMSSEGDDNVYDNWSMNPSKDAFSKNDGWMAGNGLAAAPWLIVDLGATYNLDTITIWNSNPSGGNSRGIDRSSKNVNIYYATSGMGNYTANSKATFNSSGWKTLVTGFALTTNSGAARIDNPNGVLTGDTTKGVQARYIAIEVTATKDGKRGSLQYAMLGEVQFFGTVAGLETAAKQPNDRSKQPTEPAATHTTELEVPETAAKQANDPPKKPIAPAATHAMGLRVPEGRDDGLKVADLGSVASDKEALRQLVVKLGDGEFGEVCSLLIAKGDTLLLEQYFRDADIDKLHPTRSHTKSVTSYAVGKAIEQGKIKSVDEPILKYLPEVDASKVIPGVEKITIEDCLTMSAGLRGSKQNKQPKGLKKDAVVPWILQDWTEELVTGNRRFSYSYSDPIIISHVLFNATGKTFEEIAVEHFFQPMGINKYRFRTLGTGLTNPIDNMKLRSRDMLKLGLLTLNGGVWNGNQLLNESYIDEATSPHAIVNKQESYGYFWWVNRINVKGKPCEVKTAFGAGGQMIYVIRGYDMVVVFTAEKADKRKLLKILQDTIVPAFDR